MKSLKLRIEESVNESSEMELDDALLELQIMGYKIREVEKDKIYTAKKESYPSLKIKNIEGNNLSIATSRDSYKKYTNYTYTELIDDLALEK